MIFILNFILTLMLSFFLVSLAGCNKSKVVMPPSSTPPASDLPAPPPAQPQPDDPEGNLPVPPEAMGSDDPDLITEEAPQGINDTVQEESNMLCFIPVECPVGASPTPTPLPSVTPEPTPVPSPSASPTEPTPIPSPTPLPAGTILEYASGQYEVLGLSSEIPKGYQGYTTYLITKDGFEYRLKKVGSTPNLGDYQEDPDVFATSRFPLGVKNIVNAGLLNGPQLKSIQMTEILKLFDYKDDDGGVDRHKEMAYLLQRFIVDGYLRKVNIIPIIKAQSHRLRLGVQNVTGYSYTVEPNGVAIGEWVQFSDNYWENLANPFYSKMRTFYHELGHAILERAHIVKNSIMDTASRPRPFPRGTNYDPLMDEFFDPKNWGRLEGGAKPDCPIEGC